jgi:hypothetical protein
MNPLNSFPTIANFRTLSAMEVVLTHLSPVTKCFSGNEGSSPRDFRNTYGSVAQESTENSFVKNAFSVCRALENNFNHSGVLGIQFAGGSEFEQDVR